MERQIKPEVVAKQMCEVCLQPVWIMEMPILGGPDEGKMHRWKKGCLCDEQLLAEEVAKIQENIRKRKAIEEYGRISPIDKRIERATFRNYDTPTRSQYEAKQRCLFFAEKFCPNVPYHFVMWGNRAVGKSHLAYAVGKVLQKRGFTVLFVPTSFVVGKVKESSEEWLGHLWSCDLLILDEVGTENEEDVPILLNIMNGRAGKTTIYTTRIPPDLWEVRYPTELVWDCMQIEGRDYIGWRKQTFWQQS